MLPCLPRSPRQLAAAALAAVCVIVVAGCGSSPSAPGAGVHGHDMETIFESGPQLLLDPVGTLQTLRRLGADRVKIFVPWISVAPNGTSRVRPHFDAPDPAAYPAAGWVRYDAIIRAAAARGIGVDVTLSSPPVWAAASGAPKGPPGVWEPSPAEFAAFVRAIGKRYSGSYTPPGAS